MVSIIGTRSNTEYGRMVTEQLVAGLKSYNVLVVSGLAYGIDIIAHKAALQNEIATVGVLAHGLDQVYPPEHKPVAKQMLAAGGLLTEFRSNTRPQRHNFPKRNRIVAGIADCVIVAETPVKGGSIITAEIAGEYKRDVFAIPGRITDSKSAGCNWLVSTQRATLLENAAQLGQKLGWAEKKISPKAQMELFVSLGTNEQALVNVLKEKETVHIDEIFLKSGLSSSAVAAAMLNLEFQNIVASLPGKVYRLL